MRIVAGKFKGRRLQAPKTNAIRPTPDRVRESIFNILCQPDLSGTGAFGLYPGLVVDLFAGTGAMGLEALSRGAAHVAFVERDQTAQSLIAANIRSLSAAPQTEVIAADAVHPERWVPRLQPLSHRYGPARLLILDPPYGKGLGDDCLAGVAMAIQAGVVADPTIVVETGHSDALAIPDRMSLYRDRRFGAVRVRILTPQ